MFYANATFGSTELDSGGYQDVVIAKLDTAGNWLWAKQAGGTWEDEGIGIAIDAAGNSYVTGSFKYTATFGPYSVTSLGVDDIFLATLDTNGNYLNVVRAGGGGFEFSHAICLDAAANAYLTGYFRGTTQFGQTSLTSFYNSSFEEYSADVFLAKYSSGVPVDDPLTPGVSGQSTFSAIYPNPTHREDTAKCDVSITERDSGTLSVFNLRGQCIARYDLTPGQHQISLEQSRFRSGIYLVRLQTRTADTTRKLVLF